MFKYFIIILILGFSPINWACNQAMETENGKAKHVNLPPALQLYLDSERFISSEVYQTSYFYLFTTLNNLPVKRLNTNPIKNWFKSWVEDESKNFQAFELENLKAKLYAQKQILKDGTNHLFLTVNDLAYKSNGNALKDAKPYKGYSEALGQLVAAVANFIRDMQLSNQHDFKSFEIGLINLIIIGESSLPYKNGFLLLISSNKELIYFIKDFFISIAKDEIDIK